MSRTPDPKVIAFLRARDLPCPVCCYNLRGLQRDSCPECGCGFDLVSLVNLAHPFTFRHSFIFNRAGWWTAVLATIAAIILRLSLGTGVDKWSFAVGLVSGRRGGLLTFAVVAVLIWWRAHWYTLDNILQRETVMKIGWITVAVHALVSVYVVL